MRKPRQNTNARIVAFELLSAVEFDDAYANLLLPKLLADARLEQRDAAFAQELSFGTIRWQLFYDEVIEMAAQRPLEQIDAEALIVLRLGAHQLLTLLTPPHAAIAETVELAKRVLPAKLTGFTNAILRRISERDRNAWNQRVLAGLNDEVDRLAIRHSHPVWIVRALKQALKVDGRETQLAELLAADNVAAKVNLVALPGLADRTDLLSNPNLEPGLASPIGLQLRGGDPADLASVNEGTVRVQDQGSQLMALALVAAKPVGTGERWADICAGPGGKAALLAAQAKLSAAHLFANEAAPHRTNLVRQALKPVGLRDLDVVTGDGRELGASHTEKFDRIMLDAPCTGLGALRRRPEARWRKSSRDVAALTELQEALLGSAAAALKVGGVLAYVTCSPHLSETTAVIDWARKHHPELQLMDAGQVLAEVNPTLALNRERKTVQLWPHVNGTDAMFLALFTKTESTRK